MNNEITKAAQILQGGGLVALPTETVYGLGANARDEAAVARIFEVKGRPDFNPLIVHVTGAAAAADIGEFGPVERQLAAAFWPGPLTLVVPLKSSAGISPLVTAGLGTIALRAPKHEMMQALLQQSGLAIAAPSANRSGGVSPTRAAHVWQDLGDTVDLILDGGATKAGIESTIVKVVEGGEHGPFLLMLRPGTVTPRDLTEATGLGVVGLEEYRAALAHGTEQGAGKEAPISPGLLLKHYAPQAELRLNAKEVRAGEGLLAFGALDGTLDGQSGEMPLYNLSEAGDLEEAARRLYGGLRWMDSQGVSHVAVSPIPQEGIGAALNDRLQRAAAK